MATAGGNIKVVVRVRPFNNRGEILEVIGRRVYGCTRS
jgi:hypothetical protein